MSLMLHTVYRIRTNHVVPYGIVVWYSPVPLYKWNFTACCPNHEILREKMLYEVIVCSVIAYHLVLCYVGMYCTHNIILHYITFA